jgi:hypothetical protein
MNTDKEIAALVKREVEAALKAKEAVQPAPPTFKPLTPTEHFDQMHQAREKRADNFRLSPEVERAMTGVNYNPCADVAALSAAATPRSAITREDFERARGHGRIPSVPPGGGTGIAREIPFGPSPHQRYVDAQIDAQDARDRATKIADEARTKAVLGAKR